jgi:hypothetical protein
MKDAEFDTRVGRLHAGERLVLFNDDVTVLVLGRPERPG